MLFYCGKYSKHFNKRVQIKVFKQYFSLGDFSKSWFRMTIRVPSYRASYVEWRHLVVVIVVAVGFLFFWTFLNNVKLKQSF